MPAAPETSALIPFSGVARRRLGAAFREILSDQPSQWTYDQLSLSDLCRLILSADRDDAGGGSRPRP